MQTLPYEREDQARSGGARGEVVLSGSVPTCARKRSAESWVEIVPAVGDVIHRLRVESGRARPAEPGREPDEVLDARGVRLLRP